MTLRISDDERCVFCTTSSQAYRLGGVESEAEDQELEILWSSCLECGFAVPTSRHDPGELFGDYPRAAAALEAGDPALILASESVVYFYPATPEQLVRACLEAGFGKVYFELLGDELVAYEYLRRWKERPDSKTWIRSTDPIAVDYIRIKHPELVPYLTPVVTPPVALCRYLRAGGWEGDIIYAGLSDPGGNVQDRKELIPLSFEGLEHLFAEKRVDPSSHEPTPVDDAPVRRRHLSVAGGLPLEILETKNLSARSFRQIRELSKLSSISRMLEDDEAPLGFIDVLAFEGALDHPVLGPDSELLWRQRIAELSELPRSATPVIDESVDVDLSIDHSASSDGLPRVKLDDVVETLAKLGIEAEDVFGQDGRRLVMCPFYLGRQYEKAVRDARHDGLTGLYSYGAFKERFEEEIGRANREGDRLALLLVDVDDFSSINRTYGRAVGDEVLERAGRVLQSVVRHTDIVARFRADTMVIILVNPDPAGASKVAEKIRQQIAAIQIQTDQGEIGFTASIGIAYHSGEVRYAQTTKDLFAEADAALYIAKGKGGNRVYPVLREEARR